MFGDQQNNDKEQVSANKELDDIQLYELYIMGIRHDLLGQITNIAPAISNLSEFYRVKLKLTSDNTSYKAIRKLTQLDLHVHLVDVIEKSRTHFQSTSDAASFAHSLLSAFEQYKSSVTTCLTTIGVHFIKTNHEELIKIHNDKMQRTLQLLQLTELYVHMIVGASPELPIDSEHALVLSNNWGNLKDQLTFTANLALSNTRQRISKSFCILDLNVTFSPGDTSDLTNFQVDTLKLLIIVHNMCSNLRHALSSDVPKIQPKLHLELNKLTSTIALTISDNGKGIDSIDSIAEYGYTTDKNEGTGLGIYLIDTLVSNMGGTYTVTSTLYDGVNPDHGSTFQFHIPIVFREN